jgi:hypothetical protein
MSEDGDGTEPEEDSSEEIVPTKKGEEDVDFEEHPVGASRDEMIAEGFQNSIEGGSLSKVLEQYDPEQFNELVDKIREEYREASVRSYKVRLVTVIGSIILVLGLFAGVAWFSMTTQENTGAVIFFAGTLAGYFMRLATDIS